MRLQLAGRVLVFVALLSSVACGTVNAQGRGYPNYPTYPTYPNYPSSPRGGVYRGSGYYDPAYQRGFDDGYRRGLDAANDGDRYDVRRESWYRSADRGYDRRYGSRDTYRQVYRDAFTRGYGQGYREGRYTANERYRRR
jgi:hypothetical protein